MKRGTLICTPVDSVAFFAPPVTVSPLTPGSHSITSMSIKFSGVTVTACWFQNSTWQLFCSSSQGMVGSTMLSGISTCS